MSDPLNLRPDDWTADDYARAINSWGLTETQARVLEVLMNEIYTDGWGDGNCHRGSLPPQEYRERLIKDLDESWTQMIVENIDK